MTTIEQHIEHDKELLDDPQLNPAARRHIKEELHDLIEYEEHHHDEIVAGDGSGTDPSGGNMNHFDGDTGANPPVLRVTFTPAPAPPVQDLKVNGGSLKISSGELNLT